MEEKNDVKATQNHTIATVGLGLLFIWWSIVIIIGPLTIGMGAIGMGLILLGINLARLLKGIPTLGSTTAVGIIALLWGVPETIFDPHLGVSLALLMFVIGVVIIASLMIRPKTS